MPLASLELGTIGKLKTSIATNLTKYYGILMRTKTKILNFLDVLPLITLFFLFITSLNLQANIPYEMREQFELYYSKLPKSGKLDYKIWKSRNWHDSLGRFAMRPSGSLAQINQNGDQYQLDGKEKCELSPIEKLDLIRGNTHNMELTAKECLQYESEWKKWKSWTGVCHLVRESQSIFHFNQLPKSMIVNHVELSEFDIQALLFLYLNQTSIPNGMVGTRYNDCFKVGVNAAEFHILLTNFIGIKKTNFIQGTNAIQNRANPKSLAFLNEIPIKYKIIKEERIENEVKITVKVTYISEALDDIGKDIHIHQTFTYALYLDENDGIIDGEWLDDFTHHDYQDEDERIPELLWVPKMVYAIGKGFDKNLTEKKSWKIWQDFIKFLTDKNADITY